MTSDLSSLLFWLSSFWGAVYLLRQYRRRTAAAGRLLPAPSAVGSSTSLELLKTRTTRIALKNCHLSLSSTAWNATHQRTTARLRRRGRGALALAYDAGSVLGVLGMVGAVVLLAWTAAGALGGVVDGYMASHEMKVSPGRLLSERKLGKRDWDDAGPAAEAEGNSGSAPLQLIIPGVTTPLHHLPILLVALLATQIIHEVGHAIAAALDSIPLSSAGLGLTVMLPSAFVAFPAGEVESLPTRARTRIISAGAFHNLVFWAVLSALARTHLSDAVWPILGYRDVGTYGRVVVSVEEESPLYGHVPIGAVIYKVGDDALDGTDGDDGWERVLSKEESPSGPVLGWCTEESLFMAQPQTCCSSSSESSTDACFAALGAGGNLFERCVDPLVYLDPDQGPSEPLRRCESAVDCGHAQLCVRSRGDQVLTALRMRLPTWLRSDADPGDDGEHTIVWQGARSEILRELEVGVWLPGWRILPMALPKLCGLFFSYMQMLSLSLYFFNLLPLPFLDGGQLFDILADWAAARRTDSVRLSDGFTNEDVLELGEVVRDGEESIVAPARPRRPTVEKAKGRRRRLIHMAVWALLVICILAGLAGSWNA